MAGALPSNTLASVAAHLASLAPTISVGILTADLMALGADLARLDGTGVPLLHFDVMDGGITRGNIGTLAGTGVDVVVTGSAVFDGQAPAENARAMLAGLRAG